MWEFSVAALACALTVLSDGFGAAAIVFTSIAILASEPLKVLGRSILRLGLVGTITYALVSPFFTKRILEVIAAHSQRSGGDFRFSSFTPFIWIALLAVALVLGNLIGRSSFLRFLVSSAILYAGIIVISDFTKITLIPMPHRFELEEDLILALLIGEYICFLPPRTHKSLALAAVVVGCAQLVADRRFVATFVRPIDITGTAEYKCANWIDTHFPSQRTMVSGDTE